MIHERLDDETAGAAALYALGLLEPDEAIRFEEHLREGCAVCGREVDAVASVTAELAFLAPPVAPRPELRARLLAAADPAARLHFTLASEGTWMTLGAGVARKDLGGDPRARARSYLIRLEPGAHVRTHRHAGDEHCYVISGDILIAGRRIMAGDYHRAEAGSVHEDLSSEGGCVLLIVESPAGLD